MTTHVTTQEAVETWKQAHRFVLDVYRLSKRLPADEHYGLTPKLRNSSVKIASNIVEGYARKSDEFYLKHLSESQVALEETKYSLLVARDLGYISEHTYDSVMSDAEGLSERLESLHSQLSQGPTEPALSESAGQEAPLFAVNKGVRHTVAELLTWLRGGRERIAESRQRRREERQPNVWIEDEQKGYLSQPDD